MAVYAINKNEIACRASYPQNYTGVRNNPHIITYITSGEVGNESCALGEPSHAVMTSGEYRDNGQNE